MDQLGDYFEKHFSKPIHDIGNNEHIAHLKTYQQIVQLPKRSIEPIQIDKVYKQWPKMSSRKIN